MRADAANVLTLLAPPCRIAFSVTDITGSNTLDAGSHNFADIARRHPMGAIERSAWQGSDARGGRQRDVHLLARGEG